MISQNFRILLVLAFLVLLGGLGIFFIQEQKKIKLEDNINQIKLVDLRIGVGNNRNKKGTGLFGKMINNGKYAINIATLVVRFLDYKGEVSKTHKFSPVNRFSWSDYAPLDPGSSKEFGIPIDEIVPRR